MIKKTRWLGLSVLAVLAAFLMLLPLALEFYAESWLEDRGIDNPEIGDIDLNLFSGVFRLEDLSFGGDAGREGRMDLAEANFEWTGLLGKEFRVVDTRLAGGRIDVQRHADGTITIGGLRLPLAGVEQPPPAADSQPSSWGFGFSGGRVQDVSIHYRDAEFDNHLAIEDARIDQLRTRAPTETSVLTANLVLDDAELEVRIEGTPLAAEPEIAAELSLSGLALERYASHLGELDLDDLGGILALQVSSQLRAGMDGQFDVDADFRIELEDVAGARDLAAMHGDRLTWTGSFHATHAPDAEATPRVTGTSDLRVEGLDVRHRVRPVRLLALDDFAVEGAALDESGDMRFDSLVLTALELLRYDEEVEPTLQVARAMLRDVVVTSTPAVDIGEVALDSAIVRVQRQADGTIRLVTEVVEDFRASRPEGVSEPAAIDDAGAEGARPLLFRVGEIDLGDGSRVVVRDASVEPAFSSRFDFKTFRLTGINNVEAGTPAHLVLAIEQEDAARLEGEGDLALFADERSVDLTVNLKNLDLTQVSSYVPAYHIQRGRLSVESRARLEGDKLDIANKVEVDKLKLSAKAAGERDALGEGMAMPLDTALDLLRDGNDRIRIELPVSGSLTDPEFGTGDVLRLAMQNAMQKAAVSYAKKALQPLGTIMFFAKVAGEASRPRFQPLAFETGEATLTTKSRAYLEKIAGMLAERPNLSITFCGVAAREDLDFLRAQIAPTDEATPEGSIEAPAAEAAVAEPELPTFDVERMELARARGTAVNEYFLTEHGVAADRLYRCRPRVEAETGDGPRVEIML